MGGRASELRCRYPEGDDNVSTRYDGDGGIEIGNLIRRLLFSLRFRSYEVLVSSQLNNDSRIIFHRNISDRVATIAPFLQYDSDPYLVISEGRLMWMLDAYTSTNMYPYSTRTGGRNAINYIRNSVKVVIDAYHGSISFYQADTEDPLINAYASIFPQLLKPIDQMPEDLRFLLDMESDFKGGSEGETRVVMALRLQLERQQAGHLPTLREYSRMYGITAQRLELASPDVLVMHPGPMNEGVEIDPEVAHGTKSVIEEQVANGVAVRMALLYSLITPARADRS